MIYKGGKDKKKFVKAQEKGLVCQNAEYKSYFYLLKRKLHRAHLMASISKNVGTSRMVGALYSVKYIKIITEGRP